jgi:hypothetical protein
MPFAINRSVCKNTHRLQNEMQDSLMLYNKPYLCVKGVVSKQLSMCCEGMLSLISIQKHLGVQYAIL